MASPGSAIGNVNMRTGPGTQYGVITTIPAGAPIEVFGCQSWCQVAYAGQQGYVSGSYVSTAYAPAPPPAPIVTAPPAYYAPAPLYVTPPPGYWRTPYAGYYVNRHPYYPYWHHPRPRAGIYFNF